MKIINTITLVLLLAASATSAIAQSVEWRTSTLDNYWQLDKGVKFTATPNLGYEAVDVTTTRAQTMDGLGGTFNELGWDVLCQISPEQRQDVITKLFGADEANFTYCRMPIGSSDFAMNYYSLCDVDGDYDMVNFSIDRDRHILMRYIKEAQKVKPNLKMWASPWTPPAWMKTNNHYASTYDNDAVNHNGLPRNKEQELNTTGFRMEYGVLKAYALYFAKFCQAYENEGVKISAVCIQNEPCSPTKYSSCPWRPQDMAYFVGRFLGPRFEQDNIDTEIYLGTINRDNPDWSRVALDDPEAKKYWTGAGYQWDGRSAIPVIHKEYPRLKMIHTEAECGNGSNDWGAAEHTWWQISHYLRNGACVFSYWNMVLNADGMSPWGWKQNALVSVDPVRKTVRYNPEFYIMKHLCHWVNPGSVRLEIGSRDDILAFDNTDGTTTLVVVNRSDSARRLAIKLKNRFLNVELPPHSFHSALIK